MERGIDGLGNVRIEAGADEEFGGGIELNAPAQHGHKRAAEVGAVTGLECLIEARHAAIDRSDKRGPERLGQVIAASWEQRLAMRNHRSEADSSPKWPLKLQKPMKPSSRLRLSQQKGLEEEMVRAR